MAAMPSGTKGVALVPSTSAPIPGNPMHMRRSKAAIRHQQMSRKLNFLRRVNANQKGRIASGLEARLDERDRELFEKQMWQCQPPPSGNGAPTLFGAALRNRYDQADPLPSDLETACRSAQRFIAAYI